MRLARVGGGVVVETHFGGVVCVCVPAVWCGVGCGVVCVVFACARYDTTRHDKSSAVLHTNKHTT